MGNGTHILAISSVSTLPREQTEYTRWWHLLAATIYQGITWPFSRILLEFSLRPEVRGQENLREAHRIKAQENVGVLLVMNHGSAIDFVFPFLDITPLSKLFPLFFIARKGHTYHKNRELGLWRYLLSDTLLRIAGAHPHYPGSGDYGKSLPLHTELLMSGATVCIFPEGKIKRLQRNYKVHGGAGYLAEETNALVVPVYIEGIGNMTARDFFMRKRRAKVTYGAPLRAADVLTPTDPVPERYQNSAARIMDRVYALDEK